MYSICKIRLSVKFHFLILVHHKHKYIMYVASSGVRVEKKISSSVGFKINSWLGHSNKAYTGELILLSHNCMSGLLRTLSL